VGVKFPSSEFHARRLASLSEKPTAQVLIVGGGINGISTFRDLALQGVSVVLVERQDFCQGSSAASSHMIHGGIRYLENGELRLVKESLQERNRLLVNAPHYVRPLTTTIPIFSVFSGLLSAPLRLLTHKQGRAQERGALLIKVGLMLYDLFGKAGGTLPPHRFLGRKKSLQELPDLDPSVAFTATYTDAAMQHPERLALDVVKDGLVANSSARAFNYVSARGFAEGQVVLCDEISGAEFLFTPDVIVNATGPWTDATNAAWGFPTQWLGGTKGSHIVLDNAALLTACAGREIFFENSDGRIVLMYPLGDRVLVGTTDIPVESPDEVSCTPEEVAYFFDLIRRVFPNIPIQESDIVYRYAGVRPLPVAGGISPGFVSRDYRIEKSLLGSTPLFSLVGGKWTTFRALGEHLANDVLEALGRPRKVSTATLPIGGGVGFPRNEQERRDWVIANRGDLSSERAEVLLSRYGTLASVVMEDLHTYGDTPLHHNPDFSVGEITSLVTRECVVTLSDVVMRRTRMAFTGVASLEVLTEIADVMAAVLGWSSEDTLDQVATVSSLLG
jgi:glycerol-3-phosphate dehydrogenase